MNRLFAWCPIAVLATALSPAVLGATPEVTADQFTLKLVSGNPNGFAEYAPVLTPIPETDGSFHGSGGFFDINSTYNVESTSCLNGCQLASQTAAPPLLPDVMEINFTKPVSSASVVINADDQFNSAVVQAFNSAGQVIAVCGGYSGPPGYSSPPGCPSASGPAGLTWQLTINEPGIAHLLAGEENAGIDPVTFTVPKAGSVPEPSTLALFALGILGFGLMRRRRN